MSAQVESTFVRTDAKDPVTGELLYPTKMVPLPIPQIEFIERLGSNPGGAGSYDFAESYVDTLGGITAMGPVTTINLEENSNYFVRFQQDRFCKAVGRVLWCRRNDGGGNPQDQQWRPAGTQSDNQQSQNTPFPFLPMTGWEDQIVAGFTIHRCVRNYSGQAWFTYDERVVSNLEPPEHAPQIFPQHVPNKPFGVRVRWVGSEGPGLPSETITVQPYDGLPGTAHSPFSIRVLDPIRNGVKGLYVELWDYDVADWCLQQHPDQTDYLWPVSTRVIDIKNQVINPGLFGMGMISHTDTEICPAQNCLQYSKKSVIIVGDVVTKTPLINPVNTDDGTAIERTIQAENGMPWSIKKPGGYEKMPGFVEASIRTRLVNCTIDGSNIEGGIEFCGYENSSAFGFQPIDCKIRIDSPNSYVMRQLTSARGPNHRGTSELIIKGITYGAVRPFLFEGEQSANLEVRDPNGKCYGNGEHFSLNTGGSLRMTGQVAIEGGRSIVANIAGRYIEIENFFTDKGIPVYVDVSKRSAPLIRIKAAIPNQQDVKFVHIVDNACAGKDLIVVYLQGRIDQTDVIASIFSTRFGGIEVHRDWSVKHQGYVATGPTLEWWQETINDPPPYLHPGQLAEFVPPYRSYAEIWGDQIGNPIPKPPTPPPVEGALGHASL